MASRASSERSTRLNYQCIESGQGFQPAYEFNLISLQDQKMERETNFEIATCRVEADRSAPELLPQNLMPAKLGLRACINSIARILCLQVEDDHSSRRRITPSLKHATHRFITERAVPVGLFALAPRRDCPFHPHLSGSSLLL